MARTTTDVPMTMLQHIAELRHRLFWVAISFVAGSVAGYLLRKPLQDLLLNPINQPIFYTSPAGGFDFVLKICFFFGFLVAIPVFTYHLLRFIAPALQRSIRRAILLIIFSSLVLMLAGLSFAYFVSLPAALHFLNQFSSEEIQSLLTAQEYISFVMLYLGGTALIFQLPLVMLFVNWVSTLSGSMLWRAQPYVIVGSFVVGAILTPTPDPLNQLIMTMPIIVLYEISCLLVWWVNKRQR